jgi:hypothetical protein
MKEAILVAVASASAAQTLASGATRPPGPGHGSQKLTQTPQRRLPIAYLEEGGRSLRAMLVPSGSFSQELKQRAQSMCTVWRVGRFGRE